MSTRVVHKPTGPSTTTTEVISDFCREDVPLPTPTDTVLEILAQGRPQADAELFAMSEQLQRGHTIGKIRAARKRLEELKIVIAAAGESLVPANNMRPTQRRYKLA